MPSSATNKPSRWYVAMLQPARGSTDWERDGGLFCLGLQSIGFDSKFIALAPPRVHDDEPRIDASVQQLRDPDWWRPLGLDGVVLYSWSAPRHEPIAKAITDAGLTLIVKVDNDGYKSPRQGWWRFLWTSSVLLRDSRKPLPLLQAVLKTIIFGVFRGTHDLPMLRHLGYANLISIESPKAAELLANLLRSYGREDLIKKLIVSPHPVTTEMIFNPAVAKEDLILAVGRWDAWQKDTPLLVKSLAVFLTKEPGYRVEIIGNGVPTLKRLLAGLPAAIRERIQVVGPVPHDRLHSYYQRARILFVSSRMESGPITAAEALCCGGSVVGPVSIPPLHYFTADDSGTLAAERSPEGLATALQREASAWRQGKRSPRGLSELWIPRTHAPNVAQQLMNAINPERERA